MFQSRRVATMGGDQFRDEKSLSFDGTDAFLRCAGGAIFNDGVDGAEGNNSITDAEWTISCWIKIRSLPGARSPIVGWLSNTHKNYGTGIMLESDGKIYAINSSNSLDCYNERVSITSGEWHHVVASCNGVGASKKVRLYIDGKLEQNTTTTTNPYSYLFCIGAGQQSAGTFNGYFNGWISDVAIYSEWHHAHEVEQLYNEGQPFNHKEGPRRANLELWFRMGDGNYDSMGNFNGVIGDEVNGLALDIATGSDGNIVTNGTMEADSDWDDYSIGAGESQARSDEQAHSGTYSRKVVATGSGAGITQTVTNATYHVYEGNFYVYPNVTTITVQAADTLGAKPITGLTANEWNHVRYFFNTSDGSSELARVRASEEATYYVDDFSIKKLIGHAATTKGMSIADITGDVPSVS